MEKGLGDMRTADLSFSQGLDLIEGNGNPQGLKFFDDFGIPFLPGLLKPGEFLIQDKVGGIDVITQDMHRPSLILGADLQAGYDLQILFLPGR